MARTKLKFYQRRLLINNKLQLTVLFYSLFLAAWVSLANYVFQLLFVTHFEVAGRAFIVAVTTMGTILIAATSMIFGLILTNRIAGPIYRLKRHLEAVAEGKEVKPITFRRHDFFSDIAEPYNRVLEKLLKK